jgi:hypothetical protein
LFVVVRYLFGICLYQLFVCCLCVIRLIICDGFVQKMCAHFEMFSQRELLTNVGIPTLFACRQTEWGGVIGRGAKKAKMKAAQSDSRVMGSWTTNIDWHGPISRGGPPTPNASRPKLSASCFIERAAKMFDKGARRRQIRKAPAKKDFFASENSAPVARLDVS